MYTGYPIFYGVSCISKEDILIRPQAQVKMYSPGLCRIHPSKWRLSCKIFPSSECACPLKSPGRRHRDALRDTQVQRLPVISRLCTQVGLAYHTPEGGALSDDLGDGLQGHTGIDWPCSVLTSGPLLMRTGDAMFPIPQLNIHGYLRTEDVAGTPSGLWQKEREWRQHVRLISPCSVRRCTRAKPTHLIFTRGDQHLAKSTIKVGTQRKS